MLLALAAATVSGQQPKRKSDSPTPLAILPAEAAWTIELSEPPAAGGALDPERVYVPLKTGSLVALSRDTGAILWNEQVQTAWPPLVVDGAVYVAADRALISLDAATGREQWRRPLTDSVSATLAADSGVVLAFVQPEELWAFRSNDGEVLWRRTFGHESMQPFLVADRGVAYLSLDASRVVSVSLSDGAVRWQQTLAGALGRPIVARDRLFVGSSDNYLYALDPDNGRLKWRKLSGGDVIGAAVDGEMVYFASLDNMLWGLNRGNGNQRWRHEVPARPMTPPMAFDGVVLHVAIARDVSAHDGKTGAVLTTYTAPGDLAGPPLIDPVLKPFSVALVILTRDGRVVGLRPVEMLFREPQPVPLPQLPGSPLPRERLPENLY